MREKKKLLLKTLTKMPSEYQVEMSNEVFSEDIDKIDTYDTENDAIAPDDGAEYGY